MNAMLPGGKLSPHGSQATVNHSQKRPRGHSIRPSPAVRRWECLWFSLVFAWISAPLEGAVLRTQRIELHAGWNAVFLEVDPVNPAPSAVFQGAPVEIVTAFKPESKASFYPRNPSEHHWQSEGWDVWYPAQHPEAFLSTLGLVRGNQAYMIKATADHVWSIPGAVTGRTIEWEPDSFTFTGLSVDAASPPTFQSYFAGAKAHQGQRMLRLVSGRWTLIRDAGQATIRSGEAYWIYSKGASDFQGPVRIRAGGGQCLSFGSVDNGLQLEVTNADAAQAQLLIEQVASDTGVPLAYEFRDLGNLTSAYVSMPEVLALPALQPAGRTSLRFFVRREELTQPKQATLLKISNLKGALVWVPVEASRAE